MFLKSLAVAAALLVGASASCDFINGYHYCNNVNQVQYNNVGFSGSYNRITNMDSSSGTCSSEAYSFSGSLSPLDEELSVHFRGPIKLKQFAAYYGAGSSFSRREDSEKQAQPVQDASVEAPGIRARNEKPRHQHSHGKRDVAVVTEVAAVTVWVTVDENGNTVQSAAHAATGLPVSAVDSSWTEKTISSVDPVSSSAAAVVVSSSQAPAPTVTSSSSVYVPPTTTSTSSSSTASSFSSSAPASSSSASTGGAWTRGSYYNADTQFQNGLVFMNNLGGSGSGVFDYKFGNSLSYCASDGQSCASSPQILSNTLVPSNKEFIIFTDTPCSGGSCGYYRSGIPAYHGFGGKKKILLFEFEMPFESSAAPGSYNYDMPAIWLLNAQIPRTLQYGEASCSCWTTGCGELDLFEVLAAGNTQMTTTLHNKQGGSGAGSADYFTRPTSQTMKAAVIFDSNTITLTTLDSSVDFSATLDDATVQRWISATLGFSSKVVMA